MKTDVLTEYLSVNGVNFSFEPRALTLMVTLQCTAACDNCCFHCSPKTKGNLDLKYAIDVIREAKESFPKLTLLVLTGGEPFLMGTEYLVKIIAEAKQHDLHTRIVTNAYWAKSAEVSKKFLSDLAAVGLDEMNYSTGDEHQKFVPNQNIVNASIESVRLGMVTVLNIESHQNSTVNQNTLEENPDFRTFFEKEKNLEKLKIINGVWSSLGRDEKFSYDPKKLVNIQEGKKGCDSILDTVSIFPNRAFKACCGLTVREIREMSLGIYKKGNLRQMYDQQFTNFINFWLKIDGPFQIFQYLSQFNPKLKNYTLSHSCQICSFLFNDPEVRKTLLENYQRKIPDIFFKYKIQKQLNNM